MKKLLLLSISLLSPLQANFPKKVARTLTNGLFYLIASSDASQETTTQAQDLLKKVAPSKDLLGVRNFNWFGKFLFGEHNTIAIPYLNYVIIDDDGMQSLSEEAQKFALGRCMMTLRHGSKYLIYKQLIPFAMSKIYCKLTTKQQRASIPAYLWAQADKMAAYMTYTPNDHHQVLEVKRLDLDTWRFVDEEWDQIERPYNDIMEEKNDALDAVSKDALYAYLTMYPLMQICGYCTRGIEFELDAQTVDTCTTRKGALEYFEQLEKSTANSTWKHLAFVASGLLAARLGTTSLKGKPSFIQRYLYILPLCIWATFISYTKKATYFFPGKNETFHWLPLFGHFDGRHPRIISRISSLEDKNNINIQNILNTLGT